LKKPHQTGRQSRSQNLMVWVCFFSSGIMYAEKDETVVFFFPAKERRVLPLAVVGN